METPLRVSQDLSLCIFEMQLNYFVESFFKFLLRGLKEG